MRVPAIFFGALSAALAGILSGVLAAFVIGPVNERLEKRKALAEAERLKREHPEIGFEELLPIVGRLSPSEYTDTLHAKLFGGNQGSREQGSRGTVVVRDVNLSQKPSARPYDPSQTDFLLLTEREKQILRLLAESDPMTIREMAQRLSVTESEVSDILTALSFRGRINR